MARAGETVLILDRDEVVAELAPPRRQRTPSNADDAALDQLAREGHVTLAPIRKTRRWTWHVRGLGMSEGEAQRLLDDLRGER